MKQHPLKEKEFAASIKEFARKLKAGELEGPPADLPELEPLPEEGEETVALFVQRTPKA